MIRTPSHKISAEQQNAKLSENWRTAGRKVEFQSTNMVIFVLGVKLGSSSDAQIVLVLIYFKNYLTPKTGTEATGRIATSNNHNCLRFLVISDIIKSVLFSKLIECVSLY